MVTIRHAFGDLPTAGSSPFTIRGVLRPSILPPPFDYDWKPVLLCGASSATYRSMPFEPMTRYYSGDILASLRFSDDGTMVAFPVTAAITIYLAVLPAKCDLLRRCASVNIVAYTAAKRPGF